MTKKNMFRDFINEESEIDEAAIVEERLSSPSEDFLEVVPSSGNLPASLLPWSSSVRSEEFTKALLSAGYNSVRVIATASLQEMEFLTSIPRSYLEQLLDRAKSWDGYDFETAASLLDRRSQLEKISTSSRAFDNLLGGGVEPKSITEFFGSFTTGKTQLCTQLAVNAVINNLDDETNKTSAVYIDTEGSFRPERVLQICRPLDVDPKTVLNRILIGRAHNANMQMRLANAVFDIATHSKVVLLIVDSLTSNFRAEYIGKENLVERQQLLNQHVQQLSRIADLLNLAVVITNQVVSVVDGFENTVVPVGGNILGHGSTHRIQLSKSDKKPGVRFAHLIASPSLPDGRISFKIATEGIFDIT